MIIQVLNSKLGITLRVSISKFWNIGKGGQSNIGSWPTIGENNFENIDIGFKKMISGHSIGLYIKNHLIKILSINKNCTYTIQFNAA